MILLGVARGTHGSLGVPYSQTGMAGVGSQMFSVDIGGVAVLLVGITGSLLGMVIAVRLMVRC